MTVLLKDPRSVTPIYSLSRRINQYEQHINVELPWDTELCLYQIIVPSPPDCDCWGETSIFIDKSANPVTEFNGQWVNKDFMPDTQKAFTKITWEDFKDLPKDQENFILNIAVLRKASPLPSFRPVSLGTGISITPGGGTITISSVGGGIKERHIAPNIVIPNA